MACVITMNNKGNYPIFISYFSTPECNVCRTLKPKVEQLANEYIDVGFEYIDLQQDEKMAGEYSVFSVPTVIVFIEGKESKRYSRSFSIYELKTFIDRIKKLI